MAAIALMYEDQGIVGGAIQPNPTGFTWNLIAIYRDTVTNQKDVLTVQADTLDGDSLVQVRDKLAAAVKAAGVSRGFAVSTVLFYPLSTVAV